jgi:hypothetical protein
MYNIKYTSKTCDKIFKSVEKYFKKYGDKNVKKHFGIDHRQLMNIYQMCDVEDIYSFEEAKLKFNTAVGTRKNIKITDYKLKKTLMLLLSYNNNIIEFK